MPRPAPRPRPKGAIDVNRKTYPLTAVMVNSHNMAELAAWCGGFIHFTEETPPRPYIKVPVKNLIHERLGKAFEGDWIILGGADSFKVYKDRPFWDHFEVPPPPAKPVMRVPQRWDKPEYRTGFPQTDGIFTDDDSEAREILGMTREVFSPPIGKDSEKNCDPTMKSIADHTNCYGNPNCPYSDVPAANCD